MSEEPQKYHWPEMPLMDGNSHCIDHPWHVAINAQVEEERRSGRGWPRFMYDAKHAAQELPRLALLFKKEREGTLAKTFRKCACCSEQKHIEENFLTCCKGVKTKECAFLIGLAKAEIPEEQKDWIKAWTCMAHILSDGGDMAGEGFITTVDDRMFWDGVHESLTQSFGGESEGGEE